MSPNIIWTSESSLFGGLYAPYQQNLSSVQLLLLGFTTLYNIYQVISVAFYIEIGSGLRYL